MLADTPESSLLAGITESSVANAPPLSPGVPGERGERPEGCLSLRWTQ